MYRHLPRIMCGESCLTTEDICFPPYQNSIRLQLSGFLQLPTQSALVLHDSEEIVRPEEYLSRTAFDKSPHMVVASDVRDCPWLSA
jgi:hypothetical protein